MESETSMPSSSPSSPLHFTPLDTEVEMESLTAPTAVHTDIDTDPDPRLENEEKADTRQFTTRAVAVGLLVGTIVNFSNMYFGLQS